MPEAEMQEENMQKSVFQNVIEGKNIRKSFGSFTLDIPALRIPQGFATALIGENGAGKTTLLHILSGIRLDAEGTIHWFGDVTDIDAGMTKERIGYTGPGHYYLPSWTVKQVEEISRLLFPTFDGKRFRAWCEKLAIDTGEEAAQSGKPGKKGKKVSELSDGNRMKLMLAGVLARDTELLLLDEPASPLDPLMREALNDIILSYLAEGKGERTVFFSTHNISDMECVTDYAIIMNDGKIAEEGFVEELREKYVLVKGDRDTEAQASSLMVSGSAGAYGYEGLALAKNSAALEALGASLETPTLFQISVGVMKQETRLKL